MSEIDKLLMKFLDELGKLGVGEYKFSTDKIDGKRVDVVVHVARRPTHEETQEYVKLALADMRARVAFPTSCARFVEDRRFRAHALRSRGCSNDVSHVVIRKNDMQRVIGGAEHFYEYVCSVHADKSRLQPENEAVIELPKLQLDHVRTELRQRSAQRSTVTEDELSRNWPEDGDK